MESTETGALIRNLPDESEYPGELTRRYELPDAKLVHSGAELAVWVKELL